MFNVAKVCEKQTVANSLTLTQDPPRLHRRSHRVASRAIPSTEIAFSHSRYKQLRMEAVTLVEIDQVETTINSGPANMNPSAVNNT